MVKKNSTTPKTGQPTTAKPKADIEEEEPVEKDEEVEEEDDTLGPEEEEEEEKEEPALTAEDLAGFRTSKVRGKQLGAADETIDLLLQMAESLPNNASKYGVEMSPGRLPRQGRRVR